MGRKRLPLDQKLMPVSIRLRPDTFNLICRQAAQQAEQPWPLMRRVLERVFAVLETKTDRESCYPRPRSSTLSYVLTERQDVGATSLSAGLSGEPNHANAARVKPPASASTSA